MESIEPRCKRDAVKGSSSTSSHGPQFIAARDSRNRKIKGLLVRNGRFYAQLWVDRGDGRKTARKFPLRMESGEPVRTLTEAQAALDDLRQDRKNDKLPAPGRKPSLADYIDRYFAKPTIQQKRPNTLEAEKICLDAWKLSLGAVPVDRVQPAQISAFLDKLLAKGRKARTGNIYLTSLRNVLRAAKRDGLVRELPDIERLSQEPPPKRRLLSVSEVEALMQAAKVGSEKSGGLLHDYLRFLAYTGAREMEALRVSWADVDFERERVTIGADGLAKNHESRAVDFNPDLRALLADMKRRKDPHCSFLFPSPQRGPRDEHARTLKESFRKAREAAKLPGVGFHHLRVFFISWAVMNGIDFMTIARWVGHKDGGVLIGKVYGDLADEHRKLAADKMRFGIAVLPDPKAKPKRGNNKKDPNPGKTRHPVILAPQPPAAPSVYEALPA